MPGPRWVGLINMGIARTARLPAHACKPTWFAQILSSGAFHWSLVSLAIPPMQLCTHIFIMTYEYN